MLKLHFDDLPDNAFVRVPIGCQLAGESRTGAYVKAKLGRFPPIVKICGGRSSGMRVGDLRRYLRDPANFHLSK